MGRAVSLGRYHNFLEGRIRSDDGGCKHAADKGRRKAERRRQAPQRSIASNGYTPLRLYLGSLVHCTNHFSLSYYFIQIKPFQTRGCARFRFELETRYA